MMAWEQHVQSALCLQSRNAFFKGFCDIKVLAMMSLATRSALMSGLNAVALCKQLEHDSRPGFAALVAWNRLAQSALRMHS